MNLRIAGLVEESIVDGPGIRFTVFFQGCPHKCLGCHNPQTHDKIGGYCVEIDDLVDKVKSNPYIDGLTISGGEPFMQVQELEELLNNLPKLNTIIYTGYKIEDLISQSQTNESLNNVLHKIDLLIDGKYKNEERDLTLKYRGSRNQRIIDVKETLKQKRIVITSI